MHSEFQKYNPFRAPSWRFDRIVRMVEQEPDKQPSRVHDDRYIKEYRRFLLAWRGKSDDARMQMFPKNPALFYAHLLHHNPDEEWRSLLQARLLAREDDHYIANEMHTLPMAIHWYEKLFFNVRDRLENYTYIVKTVLSTALVRAANSAGTFTPGQRDMLWKLFAYHGLSLALDVVVSGFNRGLAPPMTGEKTDNWFDSVFETAIRRKAAMAARTLEVNKYNVMPLFGIYAQLLIAQRAAVANGGPATVVDQNVEAFMQEIPWRLGRKQNQDLNAIEHKYETSAYEPRADDALAMAMGIEPPESLDNLSLRLREPLEKRHEQPVQQGS